MYFTVHNPLWRFQCRVKRICCNFSKYLPVVSKYLITCAHDILGRRKEDKDDREEQDIETSA